VSTVKLSPSILSADFARLGDQVSEAERAGADRIHVDVMDGHFVPNLSLGAVIVESLRRVTRLALETHLMISDPDFFLEEFAAAGSDSFLVHWEGNSNLHRTVDRIRNLGKRVGVAINPATVSGVLEEIVPELDQVLVMTVDPGFGHQQFLRTTLAKIGRVREMIDRLNPECEVEVDGGIGRPGWRDRAGGGLVNLRRSRRRDRGDGTVAVGRGPEMAGNRSGRAIGALKE
jgi:ribulose-phosphate 3-epimerase